MTESTRDRMPIIGSTIMSHIPWAMIAPHERQARANHGQSLERLARRGGLSPGEAIDILNDGRPTRPQPILISSMDLINMVREWRSAQRGSAP